METRGRHAVVLGGSMAGLLAARVLADHFTRVTLVERDHFPDGPTLRRGVPQGAHVHGFWPRGLDFIDRKLPGMRDALLAAGASAGDCARDCNWHQFDGLKIREHIGVGVTFASRPFLEHEVRSRLRSLANVELQDGASVQGLVTGAGDGRVSGVRLQRAGEAEQVLTADLVVDATGRAGHGLRWLEALGYGRPPQTEVRVNVSYVSTIFERTRGSDAIAHLLVSAPPAGKRAGVAFAVEGKRWVVTLIGFVGEEPPTDAAGFAEYARSLPMPGIQDIVRHERALTGPSVFKFPSNLRRHYERMDRFPEGYLVIGDAMTSFNPAYGQGMTVAALEAELLDTCLRAPGASLDGLASRFFRRARPLIDVPWMITTGEDMRFPEAEGKRPPLADFVNGYFTRLHHAATLDPVVCRAFFRVASFEAAPPSVFAPAIVWRVLRGERRYRALREQQVAHPTAASPAL